MSNILRKTLIFITCLLLAFTVFLCSYNIYLVNADEPVNPNPKPVSKVYLPLDFSGNVLGGILSRPFLIAWDSSDTYTLPYVKFYSLNSYLEYSAENLLLFEDTHLTQSLNFTIPATSSSSAMSTYSTNLIPVSMRFRFYQDGNVVVADGYRGIEYPTSYTSQFYTYTAMGSPQKYYNGNFVFYKGTEKLFYLTIQFYPNTTLLIPDYTTMSPITYDISPDLFSFVSDSYGTGYSVGYDNGYDDALQTFESFRNEITIAARQEGYADGKIDGYNQGLLDSDNYSFLSLLTAVIDAPITMIFGHSENQGLLNLEILGVNVSSFILGLFFVALILKIISVIRGV